MWKKDLWKGLDDMNCGKVHQIAYLTNNKKEIMHLQGQKIEMKTIIGHHFLHTLIYNSIRKLVFGMAFIEHGNCNKTMK